MENPPSNRFRWKVSIGWISFCWKLSIQHGLSSRIRVMGNLHIHLMIYLLECTLYQGYVDV